MIVLLGESGSGKTSVQNELANNFNYKKVVTYTTREPRENEKDGEDYHFVCKTMFDSLRGKGFFVDIAQYNGWWYGLPFADCFFDRSVAVLTPHGLRNLKHFPIIFNSYYISVPRRDRIIKVLQTRNDSIEEVYRRSLSDIGQFDGIQDEVQCVIQNDGYRKSAKEIAQIIVKKENDFLHAFI